MKITRKLAKFIVPVLPIVIALFLALGTLSLPSFLTDTIHTLAKPVWSVRDSFISGIAHVGTFFNTKATLQDENRALKNELLQLHRETFLTEVFRSENEQLRRLLDRAHNQEELIAASVIHGKIFSPYDTFIIDIGADAGVRNDMLVVSPEGIAVGAVTNTLKNTAVVTQFSAPTMTVHANITATTSFQTMLTGYGGGTLRVSIPRDIEISTGDNVVLPTFTPYLIGTISSIEVEPEDAYKTLYVRSPLNMYEVQFVLIDTTTLWKQPQSTELQQPDTSLENAEI